MGCCVAARQLTELALRPPEETAIVYQESLLGLSDHLVAKALDALERHAELGTLSSPQLDAWASELDLDFTTLDSPDSTKVNFLRFFRNLKGGYDEGKLAVLLILLCKGTIWEKAEGLFRHCPGYNNGVVTNVGIGQVLNTIFDLAIEIIPSLTISANPAANQTLSMAAFLKYKNRLNEARVVIWRKMYVSLVLTNKFISYQEFSARIGQTLEEGDITTADGVREMMYSLSDGVKRVFR